MKVDTERKHLYAIAQSIMNRDVLDRDDTDIRICFCKSEGISVCYYESSEQRIIADDGSRPPWWDQVDPMQGGRFKISAGTNEAEWGYASPVHCGDDIPFVLVLLDHEPASKLQQQNLYLLARLVATDYMHNRTVEKVFLKSEYQRAICEAVDHGYLTVDRFGVITYLNSNGSRLLHISPQDATGKELARVIGGHQELLSVLATGAQWYHREFTISTPKGTAHLIFSALPIMDDRKQMVGVIYIFEKLKQVQKLVADMTGSHPYYHFDDILYRSGEMEQLIHWAKTTAPTEATILIEGESGTGKELIAQSIHNYSHRAKGPFVVIDCSAIPRDLVESELFGYVDGAFTGARKGGKLGKFELSNGGTVFLDEIGEMPLDLQAKLLRVIQSRTITRVGGNESIPVDFRIIAATNRDLEEEVRLGHFRLDLFYRLNVIHLTLPPLRERPEDIACLIDAFIEKAASRGVGRQPDLSAEAREACLSYSWPGNIRELENVIERAVFLSDGRIELHHLPPKLAHAAPFRRRTESTARLSIPAADTAQPLQQLEHHLIQRTLHEAGGNKSLAAKKLGISRSALYDKIKRYSLT